MTREEALADLISRAKNKSRFPKIDNSIPAPTDVEYTQAAEAALDIVNAYPPFTSFTIESVYNSVGYLSNIRPILVDLTIRELIFTLMMDWLANFEEGGETIEMFSIGSKYSSYNALYDALWASVEPRLTEAKKSLGFVVRGKAYATDYAVKVAGMQYKVNLINRLEKSMRRIS